MEGWLGFGFGLGRVGRLGDWDGDLIGFGFVED